MDINTGFRDGTRQHQETKNTISNEKTTTRDIFTRRHDGISRSKREPRSETRRRQRPSQDTDPPCRVRHGRVGRRKRDRINTSLDDLMMLVPASKIKQQSHQTGKTDIIDLAVQHIQELHGHVIEASQENAENQPHATDSPDGATMPQANQFLAELPPLGHSDVIHAGFQDCTEQTIQYLIQVENMSMDDPVIMGLRQHLAKKRLNLDCENVLESEPIRTKEADTCNFLSNNIHPVASSDTSDTTTDSGGEHHPGSVADGYDEVDGPSAGHSNETTTDSDSNSHSSSYLDRSPFDSFLTEGKEDIDNTRLLEQLPNLTVLAQSNPAIAQLAGQIMSMIGEEEDPVAETESEARAMQ